MTRTRRTIVRNVVVVLLLFTAVSVLVIAAHLYQPKPIIPPEPPEYWEMVKDPARNGWWLCRDACGLLPRRPYPLEFPGKSEGVFQFPYLPAPGSIGDLLHIGRPDNDPQIDEYLQHASCSVELARQAAAIPVYLPGFHWPEAALASHQLKDLVNLLLAAAVRQSRNGDHAGACEILRDALRLNRPQNQDVFPNYVQTGEAIVSILRECPPRILRRMLDFLTAFRRSWNPSKEEIKQVLRQIDSRATHPVSISEKLPADLIRRIKAIRDKRQAALDMPVMFEFARLLHYQVPQFRARDLKTFMDLRSKYQVRMKTPATNSQHVGLVDGLTIAAALGLYRQDHPAYPDSLDFLVPQYLTRLPVDPFSGKPFLYWRENSDYALSCAGEDKVQSSDDFIIAVPRDKRNQHNPWRIAVPIKPKAPFSG
jgi:hypothetical protein